MGIRGFFSTFNISAAGLSAEKRQLSATAENIANANTTRTLDGTPYKRKVLSRKAISQPVHFSRAFDRARLKLQTSSAHHISKSGYTASGVAPNGRSRIKTEILEIDEFKKIYEPNHPDADEEGFVSYPEINVVNEMLELISASRAYEANITVMNSTKNLAKRSLEI
ncbi:flagellar basal body rod protein FlgC [candidate division KSB1 bacterium]|nr:flagellar basal body rod protein FlgC [candidate division KSB1 bacterium]